MTRSWENTALGEACTGYSAPHGCVTTKGEQKQHQGPQSAAVSLALAFDVVIVVRSFIRINLRALHQEVVVEVLPDVGVLLFSIRSPGPDRSKRITPPIFLGTGNVSLKSYHMVNSA